MMMTNQMLHHPHDNSQQMQMQSPQSIADYLAQLLKDRKQLAALPNVFTHLERLLDEGESSDSWWKWIRMLCLWLCEWNCPHNVKERESIPCSLCLVLGLRIVKINDN